MSAAAGASAGAMASAAGSIANFAGALMDEGDTQLGPRWWTENAGVAYEEGMPAQLGLENLYKPSYGALNLNLAKQQLFGNKAGVTYSTYRDPTTGNTYVTDAMSVPASTGLLGLYGRTVGELGKINRTATTTGREYEADLLSSLGSRYYNALKSATPDQSAFIDRIRQSAVEGLNDNGALPASARRQIAQSTRAAQAARGYGYSSGDAASEAVAVADLVNQWRANRVKSNRDYAIAAGNLTQSATPNVASYLLRGGDTTGLSGAGNLVSAGYGYGQGAGTNTLTNPFQGITNLSYEDDSSNLTNALYAAGSTLSGMGSGYGASGGYTGGMSGGSSGGSNNSWSGNFADETSD